eukprot:scaffold5079_cov318-Chaetoceros_neogracile.AAC.1
MPEKEGNNSPSLTHSDNSSEDSENIGGEYDLRKSFVRRQRNEEIRPWREVESAGEVYNMEAWGQRSEKSGYSVYMFLSQMKWRGFDTNADGNHANTTFCVDLTHPIPNERAHMSNSVFMGFGNSSNGNYPYAAIVPLNHSWMVFA